MTTAPTPHLRNLAEAVKGWSCCKEAWPHPEHFDVAVVGGITDGEQYPVSQIDADTYGTDGESLKLAQFYAAANPGAVLALLDRIAELEARKPLPLSDDDRLRLRSDVARAIWDVMREHEDRCDHALEDVDPKHQVWDCTDAAIKAVHGITGGSS